MARGGTKEPEKTPHPKGIAPALFSTSGFLAPVDRLLGGTSRRIESLILRRMERLAVGAGELCQLIIGGMRDRGCDLRTIAIEIAARDGPPDEANWTAHLTTNESISCADNKAFIYAYAEVRRGYDLLTD